MPELPDVEHFKKCGQQAAGKKIEKVYCLDPKIIQNASCSSISRRLKRKEITGFSRRGKFLIADLSPDELKLVFHFGMTGQLLYRKTNKEDYKKIYARLVLKLGNGFELIYICKRRLGKIYITNDLGKVPLLKDLGAEPLQISKKDFLDLLNRKRKRNIKSLLMDQRILAGIGNEYSNEILFGVSLFPGRSVSSLSLAKRQALYYAIKRVLKSAIEIGPPDGQFGKKWLLAHLSDMRCPENRHHRLKKKKIAGRTAVYCPVHQKE